MDRAGSADETREKGKLHGPPHIVPLARRAIAIFPEHHKLTGRRPYAFRGERHHDRPMSDAAVNAAFRAMGFDKDTVTAHEFRAAARTMLKEQLGYEAPVIEAQLAHAVKESLGRPYNRAEFLAPRRKMMQEWADYLDALRQDAHLDDVAIAAVAGTTVSKSPQAAARTRRSSLTHTEPPLANAHGPCGDQ